MRERGENIWHRKFQFGIHAGQCSNYPSVSSRRLCVTVGGLGGLCPISWVSGFLAGFGRWEILGRGWERGVEGELRFFLFLQLYLRQCLWQQLPLLCGSSSDTSTPSSMVSDSGRTALWPQPLRAGFCFCILVSCSPAVSVAAG